MKPHGLRGEVVVELSTNRTERLAAGSRLHTDRGPLEVVRSSPHHHRWIVAFAGVAGHAGAEALRGTVLSADAVDDPGELWVHELVGAAVEDVAGAAVGTVVAVEANPASDLLVLDGGGLVPLRFVVSSGGGRVVIDPPAGLLEL